MRIEKITAKRHCIATAKSLHSFCSAAARPLQYDCNRIAELLPHAVTLQKACRTLQ